MATLKRPRSFETTEFLCGPRYGTSFQETNGYFFQERNDVFVATTKNPSLSVPTESSNFMQRTEAANIRQWVPTEATNFRQWVPVEAANFGQWIPPQATTFGQWFPTENFRQWIPTEPANFRQWVPTESSNFREWVPTGANNFLPFSTVSAGGTVERPWVPTEVVPNFLPFPAANEKNIVQGNFQPPIAPNGGLKLVAKSIYIPKDDPQRPQGDDAHFLYLEANTIGVADGVGGWIKKGIDAGLYARTLMTNCMIAAQVEPKGAVNPKRVMEAAYSNTKAEGSSTACIITLTGNVLRAANVGDSGFMIIRGGNVVYRSPVQQCGYNCPYQLGNSKDNPSLAQELEVLVEKGDIVIAATDGLFDNMHAFEIEEVIRSSTREGKHVDSMALTIANLALYNSFDRFADTPFAREAKRAKKSHRGGKIDDITVIVACVEGS